MSDDRIVARNLISYGNASMNLNAQAGGRIIYRLLAERDEALADVKRLDWLSQQTEAYGFEAHEGNGWRIAGPYATLREAIDAAMKGEQS